MIGNFYVTHVPIILCAVATAVCITPESRGRLIPQWQILLPGLLAGCGTLILIVYPEISQFFRGELWTVVALSVLVGAARGWFMRKEADHNFRVARVEPARDGRWAAYFLAIVESVAELATPPDDHTYLPTVELFTIVPAGYLLGRAVLGWLNARQSIHEDLRDQ
jgi:hypothetical protein